MSEIIDRIAKERYLRGDEKSMFDVYMRVANAVGEKVHPSLNPTTYPDDDFFYDQIHGKWQKRFLHLMHYGIFLPNTPTLSNAGTDHASLSACFVLPVNDSFEGDGGIDAGEVNGRKIYRFGGGVGYNFSNLRPKGSKVKSTDGVASGPVSFMKMYDASCGATKQGGRRRGASIGILNVDHPDIKEFVTCKNKEGDISNFNISAMVNDQFMQDVDTDISDAMKFSMSYSVEDAERIIKNKNLFYLIVNQIYTNGEPGLLFYDTINENNPNKHLYDITTCNPCGEQLLGVDLKTGGGESCNLGSINIAKFVKDGEFKWSEFGDVVKDAVVFLDTIIDMNEYPTKAIENMTKSTRKIGLGIMGLHDTLIMMGLPYDSEEGRTFAQKIMHQMYIHAVDTSYLLATTVGLGCYPKWYGSQWEKDNKPMRNSALTCIAPTGTISILADCSSGIEPHYSWVYERDNTVGQKFKMCPTIFETTFKEYVKSLDERTVNNILYNNFNIVAFSLKDEECENGYRWLVQENGEDRKCDIYTELYDCIKEECFIKGSIQHLDFIPKEMRALFKTALDINWKDHILMQSSLQKHCDASISKTVNMPNDATKKDIADAIILAWETGCKGFTMYREGSREDVVLKLKDEPSIIDMPDTMKEEIVKPEWVWDFSNEDKTYVHTYPTPGTYPLSLTVSESKERIDRVLPSTCFDVCTGCGDMYVHVAEKDGKIRKVFINNAGNGGCEANTAAIGRLISLGLKHGVPVREVIKQLRKVKCNSCMNNKNAEGKSCADIIGKIMQECIPDEEEKKPISYPTTSSVTYVLPNDTLVTYTDDVNRIKCPKCNASMTPEGNCWVCMNCGYSKCG